MGILDFGASVRFSPGLSTHDTVLQSGIPVPLVQPMIVALQAYILP
jgi:hypothetical protein